MEQFLDQLVAELTAFGFEASWSRTTLTVAGCKIPVMQANRRGTTVFLLQRRYRVSTRGAIHTAEAVQRIVEMLPQLLVHRDRRLTADEKLAKIGRICGVEKPQYNVTMPLVPGITVYVDSDGKATLHISDAGKLLERLDPDQARQYPEWDAGCKSMPEGAGPFSDWLEEAGLPLAQLLRWIYGL